MHTWLEHAGVRPDGLLTDDDLEIGAWGLAPVYQPANRLTGAGEGIRTLDPNLGKVVLYP